MHSLYWRWWGCVTSRGEHHALTHSYQTIALVQFSLDLKCCADKKLVEVNGQKISRQKSIKWIVGGNCGNLSQLKAFKWTDTRQKWSKMLTVHELILNNWTLKIVSLHFVLCDFIAEKSLLRSSSTWNVVVLKSEVKTLRAL